MEPPFNSEHRLVIRTAGPGALVAAALSSLAEELRHSPDVVSVTVAVIRDRQAGPDEDPYGDADPRRVIDDE